MPITLNLRQIEIVHAVARAGSISDAARALGISQPAVSKSLRLAEESLGLTLFRRIGGRLFPSAAAEALLPEISRLLEETTAIGHLAERLRAGEEGRLDIAAVGSLGDALLPEALSRLQREHPALRMRVSVLPSRTAVEWVAGRMVDLGIIHDPTDNPFVETEDLCETEAVCVVPRHHALAGRPWVGPRDLAGCRLIGFQENSALGTDLRRILGQQPEPREVDLVVNQSRMALRLVANGLGVAVIDPFLFLRGPVAGLVPLPFRPAIVLRPRFVRSRERPRSMAERHLVRHLREAIATTRPLPAPLRLSRGDGP